MAEQTTVTGSIGVIAQIFTMEELMGKVGVEPVTLVWTPWLVSKDGIAEPLFEA